MKYVCRKQLGAGTFGCVYEAIPVAEHNEWIENASAAVLKKQLFSWEPSAKEGSRFQLQLLAETDEGNPGPSWNSERADAKSAAPKAIEAFEVKGQIPVHRELSVSVALGRPLDVDAILAEEEQWRAIEKVQAVAKATASACSGSASSMGAGSSNSSSNSGGGGVFGGMSMGGLPAWLLGVGTTATPNSAGTPAQAGASSSSAAPSTPPSPLSSTQAQAQLAGMTGPGIRVKGMWIRTGTPLPLIPPVREAMLLYQPSLEAAKSKDGEAYVRYRDVASSHAKANGSLELCTVSEKAGADLWTCMKRSPEMFRDNPSLQAEIARQLLQLVANLHEAGLVHRDIKPQNVLLDINPVTGWPIVRLCDMGSVRTIPEPKQPANTHVVSRYYRAPELMCGAHTYSEAVDAWALALTLGELYSLPASLTDVDIAQDIAMHRMGPEYQEQWDAYNKGLAELARREEEGKTDHYTLDEYEVQLEVTKRRLLKEQRSNVQLFPGSTSDATQLMHIMNVLGTPTAEDIASMQLWPWAHEAVTWISAEVRSRAAYWRHNTATTGTEAGTVPQKLRLVHKPVRILPLRGSTRRMRFRHLGGHLWTAAWELHDWRYLDRAVLKQWHGGTYQYVIKADIKPPKAQGTRDDHDDDDEDEEAEEEYEEEDEEEEGQADVDDASGAGAGSSGQAKPVGYRLLTRVEDDMRRARDKLDMVIDPGQPEPDPDRMYSPAMPLPAPAIGRMDVPMMLESQGVPLPMARIISAMLAWDPSKRMSPRQALESRHMVDLCCAQAYVPAKLRGVVERAQAKARAQAQGQGQAGADVLRGLLCPDGLLTTPDTGVGSGASAASSTAGAHGTVTIDASGRVTVPVPTLGRPMTFQPHSPAREPPKPQPQPQAQQYQYVQQAQTHAQARPAAPRPQQPMPVPTTVCAAGAAAGRGAGMDVDEPGEATLHRQPAAMPQGFALPGQAQAVAVQHEKMAVAKPVPLGHVLQQPATDGRPQAVHQYVPQQVPALNLGSLLQQQVAPTSMPMPAPVPAGLHGGLAPTLGGLQPGLPSKRSHASLMQDQEGEDEGNDDGEDGLLPTQAVGVAGQGHGQGRAMPAANGSTTE